MSCICSSVNLVLSPVTYLKLADTVAECRFRMAGHILHLPSQRPFFSAMAGEEGDIQRKQEDLTRANITWEEAEHTAVDCPV